VTSFASLSVAPPLVEWCLRNTAYSLSMFARAERFVVNILAADQEAIARRFAKPGIDRFAGLDFEAGLGGAALIHGAVAWIECGLETLLPGGDHTIIVGRVLRARTFDCQPLLYWRGGYLLISEEHKGSGSGHVR
jgi:flavin reductase (DIM6/NTAB) family NADH-FMN oxidoreductase RutF